MIGFLVHKRLYTFINIITIKLTAIHKEIMPQCLAYLKKQIGVYPRSQK